MFTLCVVALATQANGQAVRIEAHGTNVVLSNGLVSATVDVAGCSITSLKYAGHEMVSVTGRHREIYFSRDGGATYERPGHGTGSITTQTADTIDYSCKHVYSPGQGDKAPWDVDVHFVVRRGVPGVYFYIACSHPAEYPDLGVGEWRMVWSPTDEKRDALDTIYIDQARHWKVPSAADFASAKPVPGAPKEVSMLTTGLWAGRMDCKYMYAASYSDIRTWGFASSDKHLGGFIVLPSMESFNDGPNKQDLTAAVGTILLHMNMNHYDGTSFTIPSGKQWSKFYGPFLIYCNSKSTGDDCWHDAQARVKYEAAQWPYDWVKHPDYPLANDRGNLHGQLVIRDPLKPQVSAAGAQIGLCGPADKPNADFQFEASGYQFWTRADATGKFNLAHVRPGTYTLYAYNTGVVGQYEKANVEIKAGDDISMDQIVWDVPHPGRSIAWEIGVPDRTAAEFAHGKDYFLPLLNQKLATEVPNPLIYTIGQSNPATDWYYAQTRHGEGRRGAPAVWEIHFRLNRAPQGVATLTLAFAGADRANLSVDVNHSKIGSATPPIGGGNGLVREAVHTKYSYLQVPIPPGHLRSGQNTIALTQSSGGDSSYVMYDYLNLELP
jgi:rhamnogalacturonan endolyase